MSDETLCNTCGAALDAQRHRGRCAVCLFAGAFEVPVEGGTLGAIGGHDLIAEIARGGMGVVYRARQREPERIVALKTMRGTALDSPDALARFRHEARAMAELEHAAILPVFAFGEDAGMPFFTMKLATGGTLAQRLGSYAGKWREIAELLALVADAVQHAHARAVLHRDLKPANILFDDTAHAYVSDFGIAKLLDSADGSLTRTATVLGTPHYLAPEIAAHDARAATIASDVWSLGVMLYELLAQRRPFHGESLPALLRAITDTEPAPLRAVPRDLAVIALKALAKEPARRYASAGALAEDLRRWLGGFPITAQPASAWAKGVAWVRRKPAVAALTFLLAFTLAGAIGILIRARSEAIGRLRVSLLDQARAACASAVPGQRSAALAALRQAAQLSLGPDVRDEFITALALPDYAQRVRLPWSGGVAPALTRDFRRVAAWENGRVVIRDPAAPDMILPALAEPVAALGPFNGDGSLLAVHTATTTAVWSLPARAWLALTPGRTSIPRGRGEDFSQDGQWLARVSSPTIKDDGVVEFYALAAPAPVRAWEAPWKRPRLHGFSPDGKLVALSGFGSREIAVADALTGAVRHTFRHPAPAAVRCAAWRADGGMLAVGTENFKVYLWRLDDDAQPPQFLGHAGNVVAAAWNPDGTRLVTSAMDGSTRLWDTTSGATLAEWPWMGRSVQCSADGAEFAAHDEVGAATVISRLRAPDVCREIAVPHPDLDLRGTAGSWCVAFSPDGRALLAGDSLGVFFFDAATGTPAGQQSANYCWAIGFPDAASFYGGTRDGVFRWPLPGGGADGVRICEDDSNSIATAAGHIAVSTDTGLLLFKNDRPAGRFATAEPMDRVALHPGGAWLVGACKKSAALDLWDLRAPAAPPRRLAVAGAEAYVLWTRDGRLLLVGDAQGVRALAEGSWAQSWSLPRALRSKRAALLAVAGRTDLAAAVIDEGVVTLFAPATGRVLARLAHPRRRDIKHLAISPDGSHVAAMTSGHVVQLWDIALIRRELAAERLDWR